jgi:hypothetical protein
VRYQSLVYEMADRVIAVEKHYTINELSELLKMSFSTVRLLIKDEPGVLKFQTSKRCASKRARTMYRIPESVLHRIIRRCTNPEKYQSATSRRI